MTSVPLAPSPARSRGKQIAVALGAALLVVVALAAVKGMQIGAMISAGETFVMPPEAVTTAAATAAEWRPATGTVGSIVAVQGVTIASELPGSVKSIGFESGADVKAGAVLVKLDTSIEEAQLASARAEAELARLSYERVRGLAEASASSKSELDAADARAKQTAAVVQNIEATIAKKTIRAPFAGRLGIRAVELGQILAPGAPIVSLHSVDPVYAEFWLPQQAIGSLSKGQPVSVTSDSFPGRTWDGAIETVNSEIDPATRNVRVRALVGNTDGALRQGMFVDVSVSSETVSKVVTIPATAVMYAPYGDSVYVVEEGKDAQGKSALLAKQVFVRLGERRGDIVAVVSGLSAGQSVVSSGGFKLRNGMAVSVQNDLAPKAEEAPSPDNK